MQETTNKLDKKHYIAKRAAQYFKEGDMVNLGVGIPGLCVNYSPKEVYFQVENGFLGCGPSVYENEEYRDFCDASGSEFIPIAGGCGFDSSISFGMIRGGRLDATVMGALQVDESGNLANWSVPNRLFGMGGAMDLANGTKKVIIAMELCTKNGTPKVMKKCTLPLTGVRCVNHIVCEYGVIDVTSQGLVLREIVKDISIDEFKSMIEANLIIADDLKIV